MTLQDLKNIDLGNHATLNVPLRADFLKLEFIPSSKKLEITVKLYTPNSSLINEIVPFECKQDLMVDENGLVDENGTISEYDYFEIAAENPIPIYELIYSKIIEAKNRNRFNI